MTEKRTQLRAAFDEMALLYDQARPGYPETLFEDVVSLSGIPPGGRILEIGCGTGQATLPLARRGYRILGIELGENLAALARHNLAPYPQVEVCTGAFEEWPVEAGAFDLFVSATAFHWLDPSVAFQKTAQALNARGAIALFWNFHLQAGTTAFFEAALPIYQDEAPELAEDARPMAPGPHDDPAHAEDGIAKSRLFGAVTIRRYRWEREYDGAGYVRFLSTFTAHRNLESGARQRLFQRLADLIDTQFHGRICKSFLTLLYVAHRVNREQ